MKDSNLFELIKAFVFKVSPLIKPAIDASYIKPKYDKYPNLTFKNNGMPSISEYSTNPPYKINDIFMKRGISSEINLDEIIEYNNCCNYLSTHKEFKTSLYPENPDAPKSVKSLIDFYIKQTPKDILERYFLLNKVEQENEKLLSEIYLEFEEYIYCENLYFDIGIPILFINCIEEYFEINENIIVRKISDDNHKARFNVKSYSPAILDPIISSATHELVFKNYFIKKQHNFGYTNLDYESAYPVDKFEMFFNALKLVTNENSGFAQILVYPHNWADSFNMDLPRIKGISLKKYPNYFDDFYWNTESLPEINKSDLEEISNIYLKLLKNENNKIHISNKRLRYSYLRDNEEDSILDIIIALETLLSDNNKGELTYKLSMRISRLLNFHNDKYDTLETFNIMKKIYDYRSAVVHGSSKVNSKKEIKIEKDKKSIKTISIANDYLREVLKILITHPKYLDPTEIDKLILK